MQYLTDLYISSVSVMDHMFTWIPSIDIDNQSACSEGFTSPSLGQNDNDLCQLNPRIHEWPKDRDFPCDPFAPLTEFYAVYFRHRDEAALRLEEIETSQDAKSPLHDLPRSVLGGAARENAIEQVQIKQVRHDR